MLISVLLHVVQCLQSWSNLIASGIKMFQLLLILHQTQLSKHLNSIKHHIINIIMIISYAWLSHLHIGMEG